MLFEKHNKNITKYSVNGGHILLIISAAIEQNEPPIPIPTNDDIG